VKACGVTGDTVARWEGALRMAPAARARSRLPARLPARQAVSRLTGWLADWLNGYRATSLTRKRIPLGLFRRPMPRVLGGSWGVGVF